MPAKDITDDRDLAVNQVSGINRESIRGFWLASGILTLCFALPLYQLVRFALGSELFSYILLIPAISFYLYRLKRAEMVQYAASCRAVAMACWCVGLFALVVYWLGPILFGKLAPEDRLAGSTLAYVFLFSGICCFFLGRENMFRLAFPLVILLFAVPLPVFLRDDIQADLQQWSATTAEWLFKLTQTTFVREGLLFHLPGITFEVAPACSGIHSTLILFLTSLLASYLFLNGTWTRAAFIAASVPLGILRNGFRILVLGKLCIWKGPQMIDSDIHHKGGPLFFAVSLVPFFLLLIFLRKLDARKTKKNLGQSS